MAKGFNGRIALDIRDSIPDWDAFLPDKPPQGAPNVLVVLYDDTGCAAWSPYGGRIQMPTMQRLAGGKNHNVPVDAWTMGASKKEYVDVEKHSAAAMARD
ncbi:hypothetical protein AB0H43_18040 [Hamadaea sp. NPDC050747]|uniref:hypothetical protein n=1 Tax=Hamadaea sp. NPDC050747 TaxID=3155789 RepID=UPI0033E5714F